jgi:uncharacterized protein
LSALWSPVSKEIRNRRLRGLDSSLSAHAGASYYAKLPPAVAETIRAYVAPLRDHFGERLVDALLFGSYARGEARADSDVDIVVILRGPLTHSERCWPAQLAGDLTRDYPFVIMPLVLSDRELTHLRKVEDLLATNIDRDGLPV